jgi:hypothetical protein
VIWRASDRTVLVSPPGRLEVDRDDDRVRCHLCGRWWRALGTHVVQAHGLGADAYRALIGLHPRQTLSSPGLSVRRAETLRERIADDERLRAGMARGRELARSGQLQARARQVAHERGTRQARAEQLRRSGVALGSRRAAAHRAQREARARALGFDDLEGYLRAAYVEGGARIEDLQRQLRAGYSAVRGDLRRAGISVRRGRRDVPTPPVPPAGAPAHAA